MRGTVPPVPVGVTFGALPVIAANVLLTGVALFAGWISGDWESGGGLALPAVSREALLWTEDG